MNKEFEEYKPFFTEVKNGRSDMYSPRGKRLIELCNKHAKSNISDEIGEKNIIAVHPYHHHYAWVIDPDEEMRPIQQIINLEKLLREADPSYKRVLFEDPLHYAMKTHEFAEEGIIDKVILTKPEAPYPLDKGELENFSKSKVNYVGGVYEFQCVLIIMNSIRAYTRYSKVRPIRDAVINNEYSFWDKFQARITQDMILEGGSTKYFFYERLFSLLFGKKTGQLLKQIQ